MFNLIIDLIIYWVQFFNDSISPIHFINGLDLHLVSSLMLF